MEELLKNPNKFHVLMQRKMLGSTARGRFPSRHRFLTLEGKSAAPSKKHFLSVSQVTTYHSEKYLFIEYLVSVSFRDNLSNERKKILVHYKDSSFAPNLLFPNIFLSFLFAILSLSSSFFYFVYCYKCYNRPD